VVSSAPLYYDGIVCSGNTGQSSCEQAGHRTADDQRAPRFVRTDRFHFAEPPSGRGNGELSCSSQPKSAILSRNCRNLPDVSLGGNVDAPHHCYLCRLGSSIDHFGASRPPASRQSRSNRTHCLPYRASGRRMRLRISAHPLARSVGPLALGPLHFEDAQESISRKHGELGASATQFREKAPAEPDRRPMFEWSDLSWKPRIVMRVVAGLIGHPRARQASARSDETVDAPPRRSRQPILKAASLGKNCSWL
jgi:hypothetical protein